MKIVIATPLYPPDIAQPAPYSKEAARRLAQKHHVTVIAYGHLPEKIPGVDIVSVSKRQPTLMRLFRYMFALMRAARSADIIYAQNGASVELPAALVSIVTQKPLVTHIADIAASKRAKKSLLLDLIQRFAFSKAQNIITDMPLEKPEILPFEPQPIEALSAYETSWREHMVMLERILRHE